MGKRMEEWKKEEVESNESVYYNETISVLELIYRIQFDKLKMLKYEDIEYNLVKVKSEYTSYV